jgi:hypothetical protein
MSLLKVENNKAGLTCCPMLRNAIEKPKEINVSACLPCVSSLLFGSLCSFLGMKGRI